MHRSVRGWRWRTLAIAGIVVPMTAVFFGTFASAALAGNLFATGHDMDFHCSGGDPDECAYYKITTTLVSGGSNLPLLILDRSGLEAVAALNLAYSNMTSTTPTASSPAYVVEDPEGLQPTIINGTPPSGITTSSTWGSTPLVNGSGQPLWSAIIIASDANCGGCDLNADGTHVDSDDINARTSDIQTFFNDGGGLLYLAGATDAYQADGVLGKDVYYASVPVPVGGQPVSPPFTVTPAGSALGVTDAMANCCATHNSFTLPGSGSPLQVAETDSAGLAESLFLQSATICSTGFCVSPPTVTGVNPSSGPAAGGTSVTITGTNLAGAIAVRFGATPATSFTVNSATQITAISPQGSGTVDVTVTTAGGTSATSSAARFSYQAAPSLTTGRPSVLSRTGVAFSGFVDPNGLSTTAHFEYGLDPRYSGQHGSAIVYEQSTPTQQIGSDFSNHTVSTTVAGLVPNALYHFRLVASNSSGTVTGPDQTFTTNRDPAPPPPVLGKSFDAKPVSGIVFIKLPHGNAADAHAALAKGQGFVPLTEARQLPAGTQIDARQGSLQVLAAAGLRRGKLQRGVFGGGLFKLTQARGGLTKGLTTLALLEGAFRGAPSYASCKAHHAGDAPNAHAALSRQILQALHASVQGHFRTRGRYSAATVRGTVWDTVDRCDGTLTIVHRGTVLVTDFARRKTIAVHAHGSYLARAIKRKHK